MLFSLLTPAWGFLKGLPREVWYIVAAALLLWWVYGQGQASRQSEIDQAELLHRITAASLDTLQAELAAMVADGEIRAERRNAAMEAVAEETAELRKQAEAFDIETVEGL